MFKALSVLILLSFSAAVSAQTLSSPQQKSISSYSKLVYTTYSDALNKAITLRSDIQAFVANPIVITMEI